MRDKKVEKLKKAYEEAGEAFSEAYKAYNDAAEALGKAQKVYADVYTDALKKEVIKTAAGIEELKKFFKELQEAILDQLMLIEKLHEQKKNGV